MKQIEVVEVSVKSIYMCVNMGDQDLYSRELPCEDYPLVFFMNMHTRTPYPLSDVRMVKGMQEYINKTRSLNNQPSFFAIFTTPKKTLNEIFLLSTLKEKHPLINNPSVRLYEIRKAMKSTRPGQSF